MHDSRVQLRVDVLCEFYLLVIASCYCSYTTHWHMPNVTITGYVVVRACWEEFWQFITGKALVCGT
jgi:hypothetical protein